jgi:hypothetical protein
MFPISYHRHRFPPTVIQHAVWLYLRFTLRALSRLGFLHQGKLHQWTGNQAFPKPLTWWFPAMVV